MLHIVENHHAVADVGHLIALVAHLLHAQLRIELGVDGVIETGDDALLVEVDDSFLIAKLGPFAGSIHNQGDVAYLIARSGGEEALYDFLFYAAEVFVFPELVEVGTSFARHVTI